MKRIFINFILFIFGKKRLVRFFLRLNNLTYRMISVLSIELEKERLHPKHRLIKYHAFFIDNVKKGDTVLDIGCGNGVLLKNVAMKTEVLAVGIENKENNVETAKKSIADLPNAVIIHSDIREYQENKHFDTVILSNILEHLDNRAELLNRLRVQFTPEQFLIRVPMFERDWLVPYKKELGAEWRLDITHKIEYTENEFREEVEKAGLFIKSISFKWGEIYAVVSASKEKRLI